MTDGHDDDATEGREAVRVHFIQRLAGAGLLRPKGMTEAAYAEMQKSLVGWLAYMGSDNLRTLAELVIDSAVACKCPSEVVIRQFAKNLEPKPATQSRIMTSWLASVEGPSAQMRGDLVELFRFLRARGVPPSDYDKRKIAEEADENRRTLYQIESRRSRNTATPDDHAWMAAYSADLRTANDIVAAGQERRAAKANGEAA